MVCCRHWTTVIVGTLYFLVGPFAALYHLHPVTVYLVSIQEWIHNSVNMNFWYNKVMKVCQYYNNDSQYEFVSVIQIWSVNQSNHTKL